MSPRSAAGRALGALIALLSACDPAPGSGPGAAVPVTPLIAQAAASSATASAEEDAAPPGDAADPATHVARLKNLKTRAAAVTSLVQLFEEAMTLDKGDRKGPHALPLIEAIARPLSDICKERSTDPRTQRKLIRLLSDLRHPDTAPCMAHVLAGYRADDNEEDIRWAAKAVAALGAAEARGPLFSVFLKMRPSLPKARAVYRDVYDALLAVADPAWESALIGILEKPVSAPTDPKALLDEVQWHTTTAAKLLGDLKSEKAVTPLLKVMLTPAKADAHMTAVLALTKIGKPSVTAAIALLKGESKDLVEHSKTESSRSGIQSGLVSQMHIATAALVLGTIGREEASAALLAAIGKADPVPRAIIARELPKLPRTADTVKAFQKAFEKTALELSLPPAGQNALEALLDAAPMFFDPDLAPWLVKTALAAKGDPTDVAGFRESALIAAMKVARPKHLADIEKLAKHPSLSANGDPSTVGEPFSSELTLMKEVLSACKEDAECYVTTLADPANAAEVRQFAGIKATYMAGALGGNTVRTKILAALPKLNNIAVRGLAATVVDHLSPQGDKAAADSLQAIIDEVERTRDPNQMGTQPHFRYVVYRLRARLE